MLTAIKKKTIWIAMLAFCSEFLLAHILVFQGLHRNSVVNLALFLLIFYSLSRVCEGRDFENKNKICITYLFSYFFSIMFLIGTVFDIGQSLTAFNVIKILGGSIGVASILTLALAKMNGYVERIFSCKKPIFEKKDRRNFFLYVCALLIMWIPIFLALYPGVFAYDANGQIRMSAGTYTTHHPLLHTLLLQLTYNFGGRLGDHNIGIALYIVVQMLFSACAFSTLLLFLYRIRCHKYIRIIVLLFLGIMPISSVMIVSVTKDVYFMMFFLLVCVCLGYWGIDNELFRKRKLWGLYIFSVAGMCLFRNNGLYVCLFLVVVGLFYYQKGLRRNFCVITLIGIIIYMLVNSVLINCCDAKKGSINEMLFVPIQQVACTYTYEKENMNSDLVEQIEYLLPQAENYTSKLADYVKRETRIEENKGEFFKLYFELMFKYPKYYIEAFLKLTQGYWYLDDITFAEIYNGLDRDGYMQMFVWEGYGVEHKSKFALLDQLYEWLLAENAYQKFPVLAVSFSPAFYAWLVVYAIYYSIIKKIKSTILPLGLVTGLLMTMLLGPCVLVRYAFPYIVCVPVILVALGAKAD